MSTFITSANTHDPTVAIDTVDNMVIKRQLSSSSSSTTNRNKKMKQNLGLDKAYHFKEVEQEIIKEDTIHTLDIEEKKNLFQKKHSARRWVVGRRNSWHNKFRRTNSWHNKFRKLFTRYEKKDENYLGLVQLANSLIVYRKIILR